METDSYELLLEKKNTCFRYIIKWQTSDIYEYILRIFNTAIFPLSIAIPS